MQCRYNFIEMQQFYDNRQNLSRKELFKLFDKVPYREPLSPRNDQFVPFNKQRDSLGRLISRQSNTLTHDSSERGFASSLQLRRRSFQNKISEKAIVSSRNIEKLFKVHSLKGVNNLNEVEKMKIINPISLKARQMGARTDYETSAIADKMKYHNSISAIIRQEKKNMLDLLEKKLREPFPQKFFQTIPYDYRTTEPRLKIKPQQKLNLELPELEKYHQMKKLKLKHFDNFQGNHSKFKQLSRHSLVLANQIKKSLQLD